MAQAQGPNGTFGFYTGANGGQGAAPFNFSNGDENESVVDLIYNSQMLAVGG
jgi:hypothetical protein